MKPRVAARTDIGLWRKFNEDTVFTFVSPLKLEVSRALLIVADGMGYKSGKILGKTASEFVTHTIYDELWDLLSQTNEKEPALATDLKGSEVYLIERVQQAVYKVNEMLNNPPVGYNQLATSMINCVFIQNNLAIIANLGDSCTYLWRDSQLKLLTDNSRPVHPNLRFAGDPKLFIQFLQLGDRLLLCSDGLWGQVDDNDIADQLHQSETPEVAVERLIEAAKTKGGHDNIAVIVCEMVERGVDLSKIFTKQEVPHTSKELSQVTQVVNPKDSIDAVTNRRLKENVDINLIFRIYLAQLLGSKFNIETSLIWSYEPGNLDERTQDDLKAKVRAAMASPRDTGSYRFVMSDQEFNKDAEKDAFRSVQFEGLITLGLLGEKTIIPDLISFLKENNNLRARTTASGVLLYITGEDIGSFFLTEEDLELWAEWWKQNNSRFY